MIRAATLQPEYQFAMACPVSSSCLGMCEWTGCPGATTLTLATSTSRTSNSSHMTESTHPVATSHTPSPSSSTRFAAFVTDEQLTALSKGVTPANIDKSTRWALANFEAWKQARNKKQTTQFQRTCSAPVTQLLSTCKCPDLYWKQESLMVDTIHQKHYISFCVEF